MTFNKEPIDWQDHAEMTDAARTRYRSKEIDTVEFRKALAKLGFNATEIEAEIRSIDDA